MLSLTVNGCQVSAESPPDTPLLWVLRDELGLTGTRYGCGIAVCGACTVHVDGRAVRSCLLPLQAVEGRQVTTIEGLGGDTPLQRAWLQENVSQCGYCQAGMIMAATALLQRHPRPSQEQVKESLTNLCRCGTYPRVLQAILRVIP